MPEGEHMQNVANFSTPRHLKQLAKYLKNADKITLAIVGAIQQSNFINDSHSHTDVTYRQLQSYINKHFNLKLSIKQIGDRIRKLFPTKKNKSPINWMSISRHVGYNKLENPSRNTYLVSPDMHKTLLLLRKQKFHLYDKDGKALARLKEILKILTQHGSKAFSLFHRGIHLYMIHTLNYMLSKLNKDNVMQLAPNMVYEEFYDCPPPLIGQVTKFLIKYA